MLSRPSAAPPVVLDRRAAKACGDKLRGSVQAKHAFAASTSGATRIVRDCRESMAPNDSLPRSCITYLSADRSPCYKAPLATLDSVMPFGATRRTFHETT